MASARKRPRTNSIILGAAALGLAVVISFQIHSVRQDINKSNSQLVEIQAQRVALENENAQLAKELDANNKSYYIERIAREKLGYAYPGETVYYDVSAGIN